MKELFGIKGVPIFFLCYFLFSYLDWLNNLSERSTMMISLRAVLWYIFLGLLGPSLPPLILGWCNLWMRNFNNVEWLWEEEKTIAYKVCSFNIITFVVLSTVLWVGRVSLTSGYFNAFVYSFLCNVSRPLFSV